MAGRGQSTADNSQDAADGGQQVGHSRHNMADETADDTADRTADWTPAISLAPLPVPESSLHSSPLPVEVRGKTSVLSLLLSLRSVV